MTSQQLSADEKIARAVAKRARRANSAAQPQAVPMSAQLFPHATVNSRIMSARSFFATLPANEAATLLIELNEAAIKEGVWFALNMLDAVRREKEAARKVAEFERWVKQEAARRFPRFPQAQAICVEEALRMQDLSCGIHAANIFLHPAPRTLGNKTTDGRNKAAERRSNQQARIARDRALVDGSRTGKGSRDSGGH